MKNFVTMKESENDTGLEILLAGQGLSFVYYIYAIIKKKIKIKLN